MTHRSFFRSSALLLAAAVSTWTPLCARPLVIGHRGACGYLPEHTLESAAFAYALGVDVVEQDVVASKDGRLVVCHDIHIDTVTDVAARYPDRKRSDGRYYAIDFTWEELRGLKANERLDPRTGRQVFPSRFPSRADDGAAFRLCTLEEEIALVQGLNASTGRNVEICPEIKNPAWHLRQGVDLGAMLLRSLAAHGYSKASDGAIVQCFDPRELKRLRLELKTELRLLQLMDTGDPDEPEVDYAAMATPEGLREVATYAQFVGPHLAQIVSGRGADGSPSFTNLVSDAHKAGLLVCPYTFRADTLPPSVPSVEVLLSIFVDGAGVDGVFIDQPDRAVQFLAAGKAATKGAQP